MPNDREDILARVRSALKDQSPEPVMPDFKADIYADPKDEDLAVLFAVNLLAIKGNFYFCTDEKEMINNLADLLNKMDAPKVFIFEEQLQEMLGLFVHHHTAKDPFLNATVGITSCEALVARTGSVMISAAKQGRQLSVYPPVHIVIASSSQLVYNIEEAFALHQEQNTSMFSFVTGPSRTADIEKTLVLGAHGPKELHVFLVDS